ncbi:MAG: VWA domain-containing protein [Treponema sp.]|jgi:Ca-activated chloride channel family protein|nr:VWA domain-containing protein [Treponema sp.]
MSGILTFDNPWALLGCAIFIPLVLFNHFSPYGEKIQKSLPGNLRKKLWASRFFFRLFLICIIAALAGPRWGVEQAPALPTTLPAGLPSEYHRLLDVVIAIDVSRSMEITDGQDGEISRLERGLAIVKEAAVMAAPGIRLGAAVSRNRGIVAVPLTWDSEAVFAFMDAAGSSLTGRGTNLESLLDAASSAFQSSHPSKKLILLVSDGEALSGSLKAAVNRCKRNGIAVTAIAVGSDEGRIIPGGVEIISRRDSGAMRMAAGQTGGVYIDGNRQNASGTLASHVRSLTQGLDARGNKNEPKTRWFIFAMLAIMAFGASKASLLRMGSGE